MEKFRVGQTVYARCGTHWINGWRGVILRPGYYPRTSWVHWNNSGLPSEWKWEDLSSVPVEPPPPQQRKPWHKNKPQRTRTSVWTMGSAGRRGHGKRH